MVKVFIPVPNDVSVVTRYYETKFRRVGDTIYTTVLTNSPLPDYVLASPWAVVPYVELSPLADATAYEYEMRRFDNNGAYSLWFSGTFNTP